MLRTKLCGVSLGAAFGLLSTAQTTVEQEKKQTPLETILNISLHRAGVKVKSKEAELAKEFGKDWLNPFTSDEKLQKDIKQLRDHALDYEDRKRITKIWGNSSATEDERAARVLSVVHRASCRGSGSADRDRAAIIRHSGLLRQTTAMGLPSHDHFIRTLTVTGDNESLAEVLKLRKNPDRYDILQIFVARDKLPTGIGRWN